MIGFVKCPFCGHEQDPATTGDHSLFEDGESHEQTCEACKKSFTYTIYVSFSYETDDLNASGATK